MIFYDQILDIVRTLVIVFACVVIAVIIILAIPTVTVDQHQRDVFAARIMYQSEIFHPMGVIEDKRFSQAAANDIFLITDSPVQIAAHAYVRSTNGSVLTDPIIYHPAMYDLLKPAGDLRLAGLVRDERTLPVTFRNAQGAVPALFVITIYHKP